MKKIIDCWLGEKQIDFLFIHNYVIITLTKLITEFMYSLVQYVFLVVKFTTQSYIPLLNCYGNLTVAHI